MSNVLEVDFASTHHRDAAIIFYTHLSTLVKGRDGTRAGNNALKDGVEHAVQQLASYVGEEAVKKPFAWGEKTYSTDDLVEAIFDYLQTEPAREKVLKLADLYSSGVNNDACAFIRDALIHKNFGSAPARKLRVVSGPGAARG